MVSRNWIIFVVLQLDSLNPFVYCSKHCPLILVAFKGVKTQKQ